jgi:hypothetical protein
MSVMDVCLEQVSAKSGSATMHGWNTCRMVKFGGEIFVIANRAHGPDEDPHDWSLDRGEIFKRNADGTWNKIAEVAQRFYTGGVDAFGRLWMVEPRTFSNVTLWRTFHPITHPEAFDKIERLYDGTCAYLGFGADDTGNALFMHAEDTNHTFQFANAMVPVFNDHATETWHKYRLPTPEGRFGYVGIALKGRTVRAVTQSTIYDPVAEPNDPHYNWRMLRLMACDDLTEGNWVNRPLLKARYGQLHMFDMMQGPDKAFYITCRYRGGDESYEATEQLDIPLRIIRVDNDDLTDETFFPGIDAHSCKVFADSKGRWFMVARPGIGGHRNECLPDTALKLWQLDPADSFKPLAEWDMPGTEKLASMLHVLRPERFGGEDDGDTIHLMSSDLAAIPFGTLPEGFGLWHIQFTLPE